MSKSCYHPDCKKIVALSCNCANKVLSCIDHIGYHLIQEIEHKIVNVAIKLSNESKSMIQNEYKRLMQNFDEAINHTKIECQNLIELILRETSDIIKTINIEKKKIKVLFMSSLNNELVDKDDLKSFESYSNISFDSAMKAVEENDLKDEISSSIQRQKKWFLEGNGFSTKYLFYHNGSAFKVADLESLKFVNSPVNFTENIAYCGFTLIDNNRFFVHGNSAGGTLVRILDFQKKTVEKLPDCDTNYLHGMCYFENSVYTFGGNNNNSYSKKFDFSQNKWSSLATFPTPSYRTSLSINNKMIYVTGYQSGDILKYDVQKNSFTSAMKLPANINKYLFDDWIVMQSQGFYRFKNFRELIKIHDFADSFDNLFAFGGFRNSRFIFFVFSNNTIYKINIESKKLEKITIS